MDRCSGFRSVRRDLRGDWVPWLYAAADRATSWRVGGDSGVVIFFHGFTSHQSLGHGRDDADCFWRGYAAWTSRVGLWLSHSEHDWPRHYGHWAVCLLVDRHRGRLHGATDHRDGRRP